MNDRHNAVTERQRVTSIRILHRDPTGKVFDGGVEYGVEQLAGQVPAIGDKMTTVAVSRLVPDKGGIARMTEAEFDGILRVALAWLPVPSTPAPEV